MNWLTRPIFWILLLALISRLWGITYGFPFFLINDETPHVYGALKMVELKTLIPALHQEEFRKVLYYPVLPSYFFLLALSPVIAANYILSGAPALSEYKTALALDPSFIWIAARLWMALLGVADIIIIYLLSRRMFQSERAAILAALFLSLSFWHIQLSHNVRHWLMAAFLLSILWLLALKIAEGRAGLKTYALGGLIAGMAAGGVNTAAVVGLIPLLFAHFSLLYQAKLGTRKIAVLLAVFAASAAVLFLLYPYGLTRAEGAPSAAADIAGRFSALGEKNFAGWLKLLADYARTFWQYETPLFLAAILGMVILLAEKKRFWVVTALLLAAAAFSLIYLFDDFTSRAVIFILPIFSVFAGYAASRIIEKLSNLVIKKLKAAPRAPNYSITQLLNYLITFLLLVLFFGWQLVADFRYQRLLSQKDTRLLARDWIFENIPPGSKILMDSQYLRLTNTPEGIRRLQQIDSSALRAADRALLDLPAERYPRPAYEVLNLNLISPGIRRDIMTRGDFLRRSPFDYLVIEYASSGGIQEDLRQLTSGAESAKHISPWRRPEPAAYDGSGKMNGLSLAKLWRLERFGLFVDIYRLPQGQAEYLK